MTKKKMIYIIVVIFLIAYFYPRNAYKILQTKANLGLVEEVKITTYYPGLTPISMQSIKTKSEREVLWDELRKIKVVRMPLLKYTSKTSEENRYAIELKNEKVTLYYIDVDEIQLVIDGNYYWIINKKDTGKLVLLN